MSLRFCLLASGSKGNATFIQGPQGALLVDCGLSAKELLARLEAASLPAGEIKAIILTHEHGDHARGVGVAARRLGCPVYASPATLASCRGLGRIEHRPLEVGRRLTIAGVGLRTFSTPHDAADPSGLVAEVNGLRLGLATDLGAPTHLVRARLAGCQALVLESNHDPQMLAAGPYPQHLKQRVGSRQGHLSNQQGAELLASLLHPGLQLLVLAHLSEINNLPARARQAAGEVLARAAAQVRLEVAGQHRPSRVFDLE